MISADLPEPTGCVGFLVWWEVILAMGLLVNCFSTVPVLEQGWPTHPVGLVATPNDWHWELFLGCEQLLLSISPDLPEASWAVW